MKTTPNAPHRDEPRARTPYEIPSAASIAINNRSQAYKDALSEGLVARGEIDGCTLLFLSRLEKRRFMLTGSLRFYGYAALVRIPGDWLIKGRGMTPESAILAALEQPAPFNFGPEPEERRFQPPEIGDAYPEEEPRPFGRGFIAMLVVAVLLWSAVVVWIAKVS